MHQLSKKLFTISLSSILIALPGLSTADNGQSTNPILFKTDDVKISSCPWIS